MTNFNFLKCTLKNYDVTDWSDQPGYVKLSDIQDGNAVCQVIHSDTDTVAVEFVLTDLRYICINHPAVRELDICSLSYRIKDYIATIHIKMPGNSAAAELKTCIQYMQMQLENGNSALVDSLKPIAGHYYYVDIKGGPNSRLFCYLDKEVLAMYEKPTDYLPLHYSLFHQEGPKQNVVEIISVDKTKGVLCVETFNHKFSFVLRKESQVQVPLLRELMKIKPKPSYSFRSAADFVKWNPPAENEPVPDECEEWDTCAPPSHASCTQPVVGAGAGRWLAAERYASTADSAERFACTNDGAERLACTADMVDPLINGNLDDAPEAMQITWIMAENEMQDIIQNSLVPGSTIQSGGLDPNSFEHFQRCINEIQDELLKQKYEIALSHLRGTKKVFSESVDDVLKNALTQKSEIEMMKGIYCAAAAAK